MKKVIYYAWLSPVGLFTIVPDGRGRWNLAFSKDPEEWGETIGNYAEARMAAGDVDSHVTGCVEWDISKGNAPDGLMGWEQLTARV